VKRWLMAALLFLLACNNEPADGPGDPLDPEIIAAVERGWEERPDLPDIKDSCLLEEARVLHATAEEFRRRCAYPETKAAACMAQWKIRGFVTRGAPLVVLSPGWEIDERGEPAIHELMHWLTACLLDRQGPDSADSRHTDPRVWRDRGDPDSAQGRARRAYVEQSAED
jgi:hypothetical protein